MPDDWKTYRTRFVVRAKQLTQPFTFTDINGREHFGRPGDYLIESPDGLRISRREIFENCFSRIFRPKAEVRVSGLQSSVASLRTIGGRSGLQITREVRSLSSRSRRPAEL